MTARRAASLGRDAKIARVHKLDVFSRFLEPLRECAFGKIRTILEALITGLNVSFFFCRIVFGRIGHAAGCDRDGGVAPVTIRAAKMDGFRRVHRGFVGRGVAGGTAG